MPPITLDDVATAARVSRSTASRVVRGTGPVSDEARRAVLAAVDELGYVPHPGARALASGRGSASWSRSGRRRRTCSATPTSRASSRRRAAPRTPRASGWRCAGSAATRRRSCAASRVTPAWAACCSSTTRRTCSRASRASSSRASRRSAPRTAASPRTTSTPPPGSPRSSSTCSRTGGATSSCSRGRAGCPGRGVPSRPTRAWSGRPGSPRASSRLTSWLAGAEAAREARRRWPGIDALVAMSDTLAVGAMRALAEDGVRVPDDVAVTGFDDQPFAEQAGPGLTTATHPVERIAAAATAALLGRRHDDERTFRPSSCGARAPDPAAGTVRLQAGRSCASRSSRRCRAYPPGVRPTRRADVRTSADASATARAPRPGRAPRVPRPRARRRARTRPRRRGP